MEKYNKQLENNLLETVRAKETADKRLLGMEIFMGVTVSLVLLAAVFTATFLEMQDWLRVVIIAAGIVLFLCGMFYALKIEQVAGYYECQKCGHRYVPTYASVFFAMHVNRTRYMRCPKCHERSWQKKVLSRE